MEEKLEKFIMKELDNQSFENDSNDVCFLTREDMQKAVRDGIKKFVEKLK